jgi:hypothetical protein
MGWRSGDHAELGETRCKERLGVSHRREIISGACRKFNYRKPLRGASSAPGARSCGRQSGATGDRAPAGPPIRQDLAPNRHSFREL